MDQIVRNASMAPNFMRSAAAPVMSAPVSTANIIWNMANAMGGKSRVDNTPDSVSYTHLRAHETKANLVCRLLLEKKKKKKKYNHSTTIARTTKKQIKSNMKKK